MNNLASDCASLGVRLHFFMPSAELSPYISTYYHMEIAPTDEAPIVDYLHPEWANIRFTSGSNLEAGIGSEELNQIPSFVATGPTCLTTKFSVGSGRFWGVGLLPLGWHKFVAAPADSYTDRICDALDDEAFACFKPLSASLYSGLQDLPAEAKRIDQHLLSQLGEAAEEEVEITRFHTALVNSNFATVAELVDACGLKIRTLERMSRRIFGFPPKLLLRRQRFLRSLSQFMLDPSLSWLKTLDYHYHDQAHFVRDFRRFMTMTPNQYRQMPHPILMAAVRARMEAAGQAFQGLHVPVGD